MSGHHAPFEEENEVPQAEGTSENDERNNVSLSLSTLAEGAAGRIERHMGKSMNPYKSEYGYGRIAAAESSDEEEGSESESDVNKQPYGHIQKTNMPRTKDEKADENETVSRFSASPVASSLRSTSNSAPSSVGVVPPQTLDPVISQPASIEHLLPTSQASPNAILPSQLSYVHPLSSPARLSHLDQNQASAPALNLQASLLNQPISVPSFASMVEAPNNVLSLTDQAQRAHIGASWMNQLSSIPALSSLVGQPYLPRSQVPASLSSLPLNPSLLGQFQLASLAQNVRELLQIPQTQAQSVAHLQPSLLDQLAAIQANQESHVPPFQSTYQANTYLHQILSASHDPSIQSITPHNQSQQQQLMQHLIQDNAEKGRLIAMLLLLQHHQQPHTSVPNSNPNHTSVQTQMQTIDNRIRTVFPSHTAEHPSNSEGSFHGVSQASASASSFQQQPPQDRNRRSGSPCHAILNHDSDLASAGHPHAPIRSKEKRWIMRYEELKEFHQKNGHCRVPHGYAANRKLAWWVMNHRAQYQLMKQGKKNWLSGDRMALLNELGFDWTRIIGKSGGR